MGDPASRQRTRIVFLNGVGSAGKTSIARALQNITADIYLHVRMDAFLDMLPDKIIDHPDGLIFETIRQDGTPAVAIRTGAIAARLMQGMRHAIAAMALQGLNIIVDEVILDGPAGLQREMFVPFEVFTVGVFAPLDVLEARESRRGDRMIGLARWQYPRVHSNLKYDLEIDSCAATPEECARRIRDHFSL